MPTSTLTLRSPPHSRFATIVLSASALLACVGLAGCGTQPLARPDNHLRQPTAPAVAEQDRNIPSPVTQVPLPPPPIPKVDELRYSVSGIDLPAREILLAISRETKVNIDIHSGIEGRVTLNAIDQTLRQILTRMSRQIDMRWETNGPNIVVMPDTPYLTLYKVDYVNINRDTEGTFGVQTQVVGPAGAGGGSSAGGGGGQNSSQLKITNTSKNRFWENLEKNIKDLLRESDKLLPEGSSETIVKSQTQASTTQARTQSSAAGAAARPTTGRTQNVTGPGETQGQNEQLTQNLNFREAASVIVNPETGTISVRATSRQHEKVSQFIEQVAGVAKRQVLIEVTIVEVELNDGYQAGVDWSSVGLQNLGYTIRQQVTQASSTPTGTNFGSNFFSLGYSNPNAAAGGSISSAIKLLSSFGTTKVLSSPRTAALNNQTAVMKVVKNQVYWTIATTPGTTGANGVTTRDTYTTTPNVVPEGFVMSVTPQIGENDIVTLNIRPSITEQVGESKDPNPALSAGQSSVIPIMQTREFETVLRLASGQTSVLGGLMLDRAKTSRDGIPFFSRLPFFRDATSYRNDATRRSELIVFVRPVVLKDNNVDTDMSEYRQYLPGRDFFKSSESNPLAKDPEGKARRPIP